MRQSGDAICELDWKIGMPRSIRQDDGRHEGSVHVGGRGGGDDPLDGQPLLQCCGHHVTSARRHETLLV